MVAAALGTIGRERRGPRVRPKHAHPDPSRASCSYRAACVAGAKRISEDRRDKRPSSQHSRPRARSAPPRIAKAGVETGAKMLGVSIVVIACSPAHQREQDGGQG